MLLAGSKLEPKGKAKRAWDPVSEPHDAASAFPHMCGNAEAASCDPDTYIKCS